MELVRDGVWMFRFAVGQAYLVAGGDGLTLVDAGPPGSEDEIAAGVREVGGEVRTLFLTHWHDDHTGGAAAVAGRGVTVVAGAADAAVIRHEAEGGPAVLADWEVELLVRVSTGLTRAPACRVDVEVRPGDQVAGGTVLDAAGHTDGSVALLLDRVLFTGDTVANGSHGVMRGVFNVDPERTERSFRELMTADADWACFGHGDPVRRGGGW